MTPTEVTQNEVDVSAVTITAQDQAGRPWVPRGATPAQAHAVKCAKARQEFRWAYGRVRALKLTSADEFMRIEPHWFLDPIGRMTARAACRVAIGRVSCRRARA